MDAVTATGLIGFVGFLVVLGWHIIRHDWGRQVQNLTVEDVAIKMYEDYVRSYKQGNPDYDRSHPVLRAALSGWENIPQVTRDVYVANARVAMQELGYLPRGETNAQG